MRLVLAASVALLLSGCGSSLDIPAEQEPPDGSTLSDSGTIDPADIADVGPGDATAVDTAPGPDIGTRADAFVRPDVPSLDTFTVDTLTVDANVLDTGTTVVDTGTVDPVDSTTDDTGTNIVDTGVASDTRVSDAKTSCPNDAGVCSPGDTRQVACAKCGTRIDTCSDACVWQTGTCGSQGECTAGVQESSTGGCPVGNVQTRTCLDSCSWGNYGECTPIVCTQVDVEPNNSFAAARDLPDNSDCDSAASSVQGTIATTADVDWFHIYVDNEFLCSVDPRLSTTAPVRACMFLGCLSSSTASTTVSCGAATKVVEGNVTGCCTSSAGGTIYPDIDCYGSDGKTITSSIGAWIRVDKSTNAACTPYTVNYKF